jgi:hypothetical protein
LGKWQIKACISPFLIGKFHSFFFLMMMLFLKARPGYILFQTYADDKDTCENNDHPIALRTFLSHNSTTLPTEKCICIIELTIRSLSNKKEGSLSNKKEDMN